MKLDELKQQWQQEHASKSEPEIRQMIRGRSSSIYRSIRLKTILESIAFVVVLFVFMTGLDADKNALWVNIFFTVVVALGIANNLILYRSLTFNAQGESLQVSLQKVVNRLWWQIQLSVVFSILFFGGMLTFLLARVPLTDEKVMLAFLLLAFSIGIRTWFEVSKLRKSIRHLNLCLLELTRL